MLHELTRPFFDRCDAGPTARYFPDYTQMRPSNTFVFFLRWVLCAAPVIIMLGHACVLFADGHAGALDLLTGTHHAPDDTHHETHLTSCDPAPAELRGSLQAATVNQFCHIRATSIDSAPIVNPILSRSTTAVAASYHPIFLLHTSLLI
jgi:hypothetical protein